jgi:hypothetical protein
VDRAYNVRFRIDGRLQRYCQLDREVAAHLIQQYKTLARLDIADPFHPSGRPAAVAVIAAGLRSAHYHLSGCIGRSHCAAAI